MTTATENVSEELLQPFHEEVNKEADQISNYTIWGFFALGLLLTPIFESYFLALSLGTVSLGLYYLAKVIFKRSLKTRLVVSFLFWNFNLQFLLQMQGMYEMYFFYFVSLTVLLFYEDWRIVSPALIYALVTILFLNSDVLSSELLNQYLSKSPQSNSLDMFFQFTIFVGYGVLAILWSQKQRKQTREAGLNQLRMEKQVELMDINIEFADAISQGNLNADYGTRETDKLGQSLMNMRDSLLEAAVREEREKFVNLGLTKIGDILRNNADNLTNLCDRLIAELVDYMQINQGGIFIIEETDAGERYLELKAARAFERKKYLEKRIEFGQGLVGQVALEKEMIYLKEIPEDYVNITSGLGKATPRTLIIVPLISNEEIVGVFEMASFHELSGAEIEFLEKAAQSTASSIISVKTNEQTKDLLEQSRQMTEEMQAQEEEMRQNMEEMQATQEEMARTQRELAEKESNLNALLNNTDDTIFAIDKGYRITVVNKILKDKYTRLGVNLELGMSILDLLSEEQKSHWKPKYDRALAGEAFTETNHQGDKHIETSHFPIRDEAGDVIGAAVISRDVTESVRSQLELAQKEANLKALINNTDDSIITLDKDYRITVMNDVLRRRYKGTQYESLDVGADALAGLGEARDTWKGYYDRALKGERLNFVIKSSVQGEDSWREYFINPLIDQIGDINGLSVFSRDVTDKHKAQRDIQKKKDVLYALIDNTTDTYFACDTEYKVIVANKTLRERFKKTGIDLREGSDILQILGDQQSEWKSRYDRALNGETFMIPQERKVGENLLFIEGYHGPIKSEDGEIIGAYVISRDVSQKKEALEQISRLTVELQNLKAAK